MDKKKLFMYGGFVVAALVFLAMSLGYIDAVIGVAIMAFTGFGGVLALRSFMDSLGIKTKVMAFSVFGVVVLLLICEFSTLSFMTVELAQRLIGAATALTGITLGQAQSKVIT